jgi:hypothetical protein
MTYSYAGDCIYVRECFGQYYDWILGNFNGKYPLVTLTGTPGIGKSIFNVYFFQRFHRDNPRVRFVTASFKAEHKLRKCSPDRIRGGYIGLDGLR